MNFRFLKLDAEKPYHELLTETRNLFELGFVSDDDRRRIQDAFSDLHLKAIRRYLNNDILAKRLVIEISLAYLTLLELPILLR